MEGSYSIVWSVGQRKFFIDNPLVRILFIIEMIWWTGLAPWEFEFSFAGSLISAFLWSGGRSLEEVRQGEGFVDPRFWGVM